MLYCTAPEAPPGAPPPPPPPPVTMETTPPPSSVKVPLVTLMVVTGVTVGLPSCSSTVRLEVPPPPPDVEVIAVTPVNLILRLACAIINIVVPCYL